MDEATPHLHIDFVPYITGSKCGVDTRVSLKQALGALGFKGGSRSDTELNQWINAEKEQIARVMERHGIEWEKKGTHEEHLSVLVFKKKERAKEVAELENLLVEKQDDVQILEAVMKDNLEQIEVLEAERESAELKADEANRKAEIAGKKATKAKKELQELAPLVDRVKAYAGEYGRPPEELLPKADTLESGKSYREKKAIPFFRNLADKLFSLYLAYCKLQNQHKQLDWEFDRIWNKKERLQDWNEVLEQRVESLEEVEKD